MLPPMTTRARILALVAERERDGLVDLEELAFACGLGAVELEQALGALVEEGYLLLAREPGHPGSAALTTAGQRLVRRQRRL